MDIQHNPTTSCERQSSKKSNSSSPKPFADENAPTDSKNAPKDSCEDRRTNSSSSSSPKHTPSVRIRYCDSHNKKLNSEEEDGIPVRTIKSLMTTIPSTFTGSDIIHWLMKHTGATDVAEALNLASRIAAMGYIFCIDDHVSTVKNDSHTYYRFQTPFLYPSRCMEADTVDYAVYLCKRTMQNKQRLELAGFEAERLASLQTLYCHKWEFVYIQAEAEAKVDKKRDKLERLVLDSQERAYWDVHRPPPGCVNTTDIDMRKLCRAKRPKKIPIRAANFPIASGPDGVLLFPPPETYTSKEWLAKLNACLRPRIKTSKAAESLQNFCDQYSEFDLLLSTSSPPNLATYTGGTGVGLPNTATVSGNAFLTLPLKPDQSSSTAVPSPGKVHQSGSTRVAAGDKLTLHQRSISASGLTNVGGANLVMSGKGMTPMRTGSGASAVVGTTGGGGGIAGSGSASGGGGGGGGGLGSGVLAPSSSTSAYDASHESASVLNPWISDNADYWTTDARSKFLPIRRIKRWSFSIYELLKDPIGLEEFQRWLEKEFSAENLRFWQACQELRGAPLRELRHRIQVIYNQYLAPNAIDPLNVDCRIADAVRRHLAEGTNSSLNRYCFEEAEGHIFHLMKSDSYCRFLRSDVYRELFSNGKKKSKKHRAGVNLSGNVPISVSGGLGGTAMGSGCSGAGD